MTARIKTAVAIMKLTVLSCGNSWIGSIGSGANSQQCEVLLLTDCSEFSIIMPS
ncbi:hypothetical protein [Nostoc cycadae]|uniref:hypothetical protein n=1 Tax=Nostoc cycadae TaxID=246795 RepID=UPI0016519A24|nr:hypothetical protein [Nostoc cycadae]